MKSLEKNMVKNCSGSYIYDCDFERGRKIADK